VTVLCNAEHRPRGKRPALALPLEEVRASPARGRASRPPSRALIADSFRVYPDASAASFAEMAELPERAGRIAVPSSLAEQPLEAGSYPITIVL
jgi:hypothetical protein